MEEQTTLIKQLRPSVIMRALGCAIAGYGAAGYILPLTTPDTNKFINASYLQLLLVWAVVATAMFQLAEWRSGTARTVYMVLAALAAGILYPINGYCMVAALAVPALLLLPALLTATGLNALLLIVVFITAFLSNQYSFNMYGWLCLAPILYVASLWPVITLQRHSGNALTVGLIIAATGTMMMVAHYTAPFNGWMALPYIGLLACIVWYRINKTKENSAIVQVHEAWQTLPSLVLCIMAAILGGMAGWEYGGIIFLLVPFSFVLYKTFEE